MHTVISLIDAEDVRGNHTEYTYNEKRRLTQSISPDGRESNITYDDNGFVASVLDENENGYYLWFAKILSYF